MRSETGFDPALYDRFPTKEPRPEGEEEELRRIWCKPKGWEYLTVVNNNYVGIYYLGTAFLFFLMAGVLALLMRAQLAAPMLEILPQATYNQVFTMHGTVMMFLFAVPAVEAAGVLLLPQMLAARDLPFPRLSAYAFWAYAVGGLCFFASIFVGLAPDGGWFMYPPLTSKAYSPGINTDFWLLGIGFIEISAIAGAIEIIVGVLRTRAPGMSLDKMPIFAWAMLVFAVMIVIAFPSIILGTLLLEIERAFNWPFFDAARGGDPLLWQHLFWFFGHPEVYIIFLPAAGMMSMIVATVAKTELGGYRLIVLAMLATGFISFGVWAHHMFTTGMPPMTTGFFSAASMAVSLPAGLQVFSWIATLAIGQRSFNAPGLFVVGSIVIFVTGGLTAGHEAEPDRVDLAFAGGDQRAMQRHAGEPERDGIEPEEPGHRHGLPVRQLHAHEIGAGEQREQRADDGQENDEADLGRRYGRLLRRDEVAGHSLLEPRLGQQPVLGEPPAADAGDHGQEDQDHAHE